MLKKILRYCGFLLLASGAGCALVSTPERVQTRLYDLEMIKAAPVSRLSVDFGSFRNLAGAGTPMLVREKNGVLLQDDANRYLMLPELLVKRRLLDLFPAAVTDDAILVHGVICRFEIDRAEGKARFAVDYESLYGHKRVVFRHTFEEALAENSGPAAAAAMEKCVIASARRLAGELAGLKAASAAKEERRK